MARVLSTGFESQDLLFLDSPVSGNTIVTTNQRSGAAALQCSNADGLKTIPSLSEFYIRFSYRHTGNAENSKMFEWRNSTTILGQLRFHVADAKIKFYISGSTLTATGVITVAVGTTYLIELYVKIADSGGRVSLKIDGVQDTGIDYTGDTKPGSATTVDHLNFASSGTSAIGTFDDIALNDTTGGSDNSWCGDGHIIGFLVNGNGDSSQLVGSDGNSTDNYLLVDDVPSDSDSTYVEGSVTDEYDLYNIANANLVGTTIHRVWVESRSRDTVAAGGSIALGIKPSGSSIVWSSDITLLTSYTVCRGTVHTTNPADSGSWEDGDIDGLQIGVKTRT